MRFALAGSLAALVAALAFAGSAGAGTPTGEASKTPAQILADATAAIATAKDCHLVGAGRTDGSTLTVDLRLVAGKGGAGIVSMAGLGFRIIRIGNRAYFSGDEKFLVHYVGARAAKLFLGKWFAVSATRGAFASLAEITDLRALADAILSSHGALVEGPTTMIRGRPAIPLVDEQNQGALYVAATGKPYPLALKSGRGGGTLEFERWDDPVALTPPKSSIDYAKLVARSAPIR